MALFYLIVAVARKSAVQHQCTIRDILVDETADERDTVFGVLLWEELVGALYNRS